MLGSLLIMFALLALIDFLVVTAKWRDLVSRGSRASDERQDVVGCGEFLRWAENTAAWIVGRRLCERPDAELHAGVTRAMLPLASNEQTRRVVPCPEAGQGMIGVTAPEVLEIADYIDRKLACAERKRIRDLAEKNASKTGGPDDGGIA